MPPAYLERWFLLIALSTGLPSLVYALKSARGLTQPLGAPLFVVVPVEMVLLMLTHWFLFIKKSQIPLRKDGTTSMALSSWSSIYGRIVLKALEMSKKRMYYILWDFWCMQVFLSLVNNCENGIFGTPVSPVDKQMRILKLFPWRCGELWVATGISLLWRWGSRVDSYWSGMEEASWESKQCRRFT